MRLYLECFQERMAYAKSMDVMWVSCERSGEMANGDSKDPW